MEIPILNEVRKDEDYYLIGPFWIIGDTSNSINAGNYEILSHKFMVDYNAVPVKRVSRSEYTHKGIWDKLYKNKYGVDFDYYPRGRVSLDSKKGKFCINISEGINEELIIKSLIDEYDMRKLNITIKHTDPTSGNHYTFKLK